MEEYIKEQIIKIILNELNCEIKVKHESDCDEHEILLYKRNATFIKEGQKTELFKLDEYCVFISFNEWKSSICMASVKHIFCVEYYDILKQKQLELNKKEKI